MKQNNGLKVCSCCKEKKTIQEFYKNNTEADGYHHYCKTCTLKINSKYRNTLLGKQKHYKANLLNRQRNYKLLKQLKSNGCAICGYNKCTKALDFHHVIPKDKKFYIVADSMQREDLIEELNKCILLCSNCHREIHQKWSRD